jgi:hypothetical protein
MRCAPCRLGWVRTAGRCTVRRCRMSIRGSRTGCRRRLPCRRTACCRDGCIVGRPRRGCRWACGTGSRPRRAHAPVRERSGACRTYADVGISTICDTPTPRCHAGPAPTFGCFKKPWGTPRLLSPRTPTLTSLTTSWTTSPRHLTHSMTFRTSKPEPSPNVSRRVPPDGADVRDREQSHERQRHRGFLGLRDVLSGQVDKRNFWRFGGTRAPTT